MTIVTRPCVVARDQLLIPPGSTLKFGVHFTAATTIHHDEIIRHPSSGSGTSAATFIDSWIYQ